jgi:hypothetical protein
MIIVWMFDKQKKNGNKIENDLVIIICITSNSSFSFRTPMHVRFYHYCFLVFFPLSAVRMPTQSITEEKDDVVNARNLTLRDLLSQIKHYNANVRKGIFFFFLIEERDRKDCNKLTFSCRCCVWHSRPHHQASSNSVCSSRSDPRGSIGSRV